MGGGRPPACQAAEVHPLAHHPHFTPTPPHTPILPPPRCLPPAPQYNGDDHAITQDAAACRRQFENWWLAAGITLSGQLASSELREAGREGVSTARQQRQQGGTAAVGAAGAARSLAEDPVLQALMRKLPPEKQQQVVGLLQRMTPDQMGQARAQLQAMAGVQAAPAAPAGPSAPMQQLQAQQGASYYGQQAAPQQAYPQAYQEPQQQAAYYPQQQQVQVQQVQPQQAYGGQAYGQAQLQQQQLLMQQQAPQQQALYAQQHVQQQPAPQQWSAAPAQQHMQQQLAAQQWAAAPVQQPAIGGWQEPALQQQQQPATAWQPAARQLLEGLAALPAAAPFLQAQPGFLQVGGGLGAWNGARVRGAGPQQSSSPRRAGRAQVAERQGSCAACRALAMPSSPPHPSSRAWT